VVRRGVVSFDFILSYFFEEKDFCRFELGAEHDPWLESGNGRAL
jgi:hypothetical protein